MSDQPLVPFTSEELAAAVVALAARQPAGVPSNLEELVAWSRAQAVQRLITAAYEMCVEEQAGGRPGWSSAKSWAFDKLNEAVAPFLAQDADGVMAPQTSFIGA